MEDIICEIKLRQVLFTFIIVQLFATFRELVESGQEYGSGFAVYHKGELVVNMVGGYADKAAHRPWTKDTVAQAYSTTKGTLPASHPQSFRVFIYSNMGVCFPK